MSAALETYTGLLIEIYRLTVRDEMTAILHGLSDQDVALVRRLSIDLCAHADLLERGDFKRPIIDTDQAVKLYPPEVQVFLKAFSSAEGWDEKLNALRLLEECQFKLHPADATEYRCELWETIKDAPPSAIKFFEDECERLAADQL